MTAVKLCASYKEHRPDVLLMDIRMEKTDGLEAAAQVLSQFPDARDPPAH